MRISIFSRCVLALFSTVWAVTAHSELQVVPLVADDEASVLALVQKIAGPNVTVLDGSLNPALKPKLIHGSTIQVGAFTGGREMSPSDIGIAKSIGVPSGLILSTGEAVDAQAGASFELPKKSTDIEGEDYTGSVNPLIDIELESTRDLVLLEFYVIPENSKLRADFVFASEDYEDVSSVYPNRACTDARDKDHFGIFVSPYTSPSDTSVPETNLALWNDGSDISSNSMYPTEVFVCSSARTDMYVSNDPQEFEQYKTSYDGFSLPLAGQTPVNPGETYRVRLAIADTGDALYDSAVFIRFLSSPSGNEAPTSFEAGPFSTKTPNETILTAVSDPNGPVDQAELASGVINDGVSLDYQSGKLFVSGLLNPGSQSFSVESYDYLAWHPCSGSSDSNPCDYDYLNDATRLSETTDLTLTFADADAETSEFSVDNTIVLVGEIITITVQLRDSSSGALVSGGDEVAASSTLGLLNGQSGSDIAGLDLGNGRYQFELSSETAGEAEVSVTLNGTELSASPKTVNFSIKDTDGDGLPDDTEIAIGTSPTNSDSDGDGVPDKDEVGADVNTPRDTDDDGIYDALDEDDDGDKVPTIEEGRSDNDLDYIPNYLDTVPDEVSLTGDNDGDGIQNQFENPGLLFAEVNVLIDTDGDFLPNAIDTDSDNDGVLDSDEWPVGGALSSDSDNIIDYADSADKGSGPGDSDGDGIPDDIECGALVLELEWFFCLQSDLDGQPDYMELDSDDDGLPDSLEAGSDPTSPVDSDRDGRADYRDLDSDNDGLPDSFEAGSDPTNPVDFDKDGLADYLDLDSDNDGWSDAKECPDYSSCADIDGNGIPDYLDPGMGDSLGVVKTQTDGIGGVGTFSLGALILMLSLRLRRKAIFFFAAFPLLGVSGQDAFAQSGSFYGGFNLGVSSLEPDISGAPAISTDQKQDVSIKLNFGYDISEHFSAEGFWANLGEASFSPQGALSYEALGVGVIGHYFYTGEARTYGSAAIFLKTGFASLLNASSDIEFENDNSISLYYGIGTEYWLSDQWSARLGMTTYDKDASEISVGVVYRFSAEKISSPRSEKSMQHPLDRFFKAFAAQSEAKEPIEQAAPAAVKSEPRPVEEEALQVEELPESLTVESEPTPLEESPEFRTVEPEGPYVEDPLEPESLDTMPARPASELQGAPPVKEAEKPVLKDEEEALQAEELPESRTVEPEAPYVEDPLEPESLDTMPAQSASELQDAPPVKEAEKPVFKDEDSDGVADRNDECPYTPEGTKVGVDGCAEYRGIWREMN